MKNATIDDITMTECCMIITGFGEVWEHDKFCVGHELIVLGVFWHDDIY